MTLLLLTGSTLSVLLRPLTAFASRFSGVALPRTYSDIDLRLSRPHAIATALSTSPLFINSVSELISCSVTSGRRAIDEFLSAVTIGSARSWCTRNLVSARYGLNKIARPVQIGRAHA